MKTTENNDKNEKNNISDTSLNKNNKQNKNWNKFVLKIILILFLVSLLAYLCFSDNGLVDFLHSSPRIDLGWLAMAFFCQLIDFAADSILIYKFINADKKINILQSIDCCLIGQFFSAITPASSGRQPMQVYALSKRGIAAGATTSALTQKFVVYQTSLIIYCTIAILLRIDYFLSLNKIIYLFLVIGFLSQLLLAVGLVVFSFNKKITTRLIFIIIYFLKKFKFFKNSEETAEKIQHQLKLFHKGNLNLYKNKYLVLETYVLTAIQLTATFIVPYCIYRSFGFSGERVPDMISAQVFITMAVSLLPIPGSSGAAEGASSIFLRPFFDEYSIKSAIVLTRIVTFYFTILVSAPTSLWLRRTASKTQN